MSTVMQRSLALALGGLVAGLALVYAIFGLPERSEPGGSEAPPQPLALRSGTEAGEAGPGRTAEAGKPAATKPADIPPAEAGPQDLAAPSFDIVRVEPNGEAVVAGRGTPNTVVEMLLDGRPVARALADPEGQFALVPPALPPGSSEIVLRTTAADGRESRSRQSVAVAVAARRDARPLVALTSPDAPTVVLSRPEAAREETPKPGAGPAGKPGTGTPAAKAPRIVSIDARDGGRLIVSGESAPGAKLRLYLNDTLIAPGRADGQGRVSFVIGKGVQPGAYRVRLDQAEAEGGKVRARAEVPFTMPDTVRLAQAERPSTPAEAPLPVRPAAPPVPSPAPPAAPPREALAGRPAPAPAESRAPGQPARPPAPAAGPAERRSPALAEAPAGAAPAWSADAARIPGKAAMEAGRTGAAAGPAAEARPDGPPAAPAPVYVPEIATTRITRGDSLWQISKRAYGRGYRYTVIYDANQEQIRDPDLIYPGQIFVLPADARAPDGRRG